MYPALSSPARRSPVPKTVEVVAPAVEPWVFGDEALMQQLALDAESDSSVQAAVTGYIAAARRQFEAETSLCLVNRTLRTAWDYIPYGCGAREIELPRAPLVSVTDIRYTDTAGAEQVWDAANYQVCDAGVDTAFPRIRLKPGCSWPELGDYAGAFRVTYVAGYGADRTRIEDDIRFAISSMVAYWNDNHLPVNVGNIVNEMPFHAAFITQQRRLASIV